MTIPPWVLHRRRRSPRPPTDRTPDFGTATVSAQTYTVGQAITTLTLPAASGGDGTLTYSLSPGLPAGLTFNAAARTITGTPTAAQAATGYTYTVRDADGDTDTLTFNITVNAADGTPPVTDPCGQAITADGTYSGSWAAGCQSQVPERGYARYYTFTLAQASTVTIDLVSDTDPYLYVRAGGARSGETDLENDDVVPGTNLNSQLTLSLAAGAYTIEATTYAAGETGNFTLTIAGLGGATTPDPGTDPCGQAITADGAYSGNWASDCQSAARSGSYARYYTFTLAQASSVTIDLVSDTDPYLYVRAGAARSGETDLENDDVVPGTNLNSQLTLSLAAGAYTIEATTYAAGETGNFTLTIAGLGGTTTPDPGTDPCGQAITADGTYSGSWAAGCQSEVTDRGYARYYTFTLAQASTVTIDLVSEGVDPYLLLRPGTDRSGATDMVSDDVDWPANWNSRLSESLAAGAYTIEATTYNAGETGSFTLTVSGLGGATTPDPDPDPGTEACEEAINPDGDTVTGTWASDCQSQAKSGHYARYYTFTLAQQSDVTIDLVSETDPYLYLWRGDARSGTPVAENDDIVYGQNLNSQIMEQMVAGTYTIEATTFAAGETGTFTLTISAVVSGGG